MPGVGRRLLRLLREDAVETTQAENSHPAIEELPQAIEELSKSIEELPQVIEELPQAIEDLPQAQVAEDPAPQAEEDEPQGIVAITSYMKGYAKEGVHAHHDILSIDDLSFASTLVSIRCSASMGTSAFCRTSAPSKS